LSLTVYAVPLDELARVPGSRDRALIDAVVAESEYSFSQVDEMAERFDEEEDGEENRVPTCRVALTRLVEGEDLGDVPGHHGYVYGYVLEGVCSHLGEEMENVSAISGSSRWMDGIDRLLAEVEVPLSLVDLVYGGSPIRIPEPDDYPAIGRWSPEQVERALGPLRGVYAEPSKGDEWDTVLQIRRWVEFAAARPGHGIVGFLS
jgi:hypothetical protein